MSRKLNPSKSPRNPPKSATKVFQSYVNCCVSVRISLCIRVKTMYVEVELVEPYMPLANKNALFKIYL
jgi:hypothetical protein